MRNQKCIRKTISEDTGIKSFLDMIAPSVVKFNPDHFICGNTFRCVWALREYPTQTDEQALLRHLGEKDGITLRIYTRQLTPVEEDRIIQNATNKNRMGSSNTNDLRQTVTAESNLQDVASLIASMHRNREPLFHCAVYLELTAPDYDALKLLQTDVLTELVRSKLNVDKLLLRQQQGFCCVSPVGYNAFGAQFERVLPANSVANLYPFNYSGKTDAKGFYIGKDKYGSNILVDFDQRDEDILKMLFPHDYGAQASGRSVHCCYRSNRGNGDWEEWQVETLAAMILLPPECVVRSMERFGLGTQMRLLNRVFAPADYKKFEAMASFMGASKTALSIRMMQLGLLKRNDLSDPYSLVRVDMDEEDRIL